jgi:hypothetical protein
MLEGSGRVGALANSVGTEFSGPMCFGIWRPSHLDGSRFVARLQNGPLTNEGLGHVLSSRAPSLSHLF